MSDIYQKLLKSGINNDSNITLSKYWLSRLYKLLNVDDKKIWKLKTNLRILEAPYISLIKVNDLYILVLDYKVYLISEYGVRLVKDEEYATIKSITSGTILYQRNTSSEFDLGGIPEEIKELISIVDALELIGLDDV